MNTKYLHTLVLLVLFAFNSFSQSHHAKIDAANKYYANQDYANAALLYEQVVNDTAVSTSRVLPYKIQMVNLSMTPKEGKKAPQVKKDPNDTSRTKTPEPIVTAPKD